ncbi:hypothetical protein [Cryobacterium sp. Y29]|nr:hypothetical protein [Cryobacterium sp. Y29]
MTVAMPTNMLRRVGDLMCVPSGSAGPTKTDQKCCRKYGTDLRVLICAY